VIQLAEKIDIGSKEPLYKAAEKINGAMDEVNTFQKQIDEIVVEGDSSVEAAQARVDYDGKTYTTLKGRLDTEHNQVTSKLAQRPTHTEVDNKVQQVADGAPKGTYTTLENLQAAFPNGDSGNYVLQSDGHIYHWDGVAWGDTGILYQAVGLADGSVTENKTTFAHREGDNLFDKTKASVGLARYTGTAYDSSYTDIRYSDFIPASQGDTFTISDFKPYRNVIVYDENEGRLGEILGDNTTDPPVTPMTFEVTIANAAFIRVNIDTTRISVDDYMVVKGDSLPRSYSPYSDVKGVVINDLIVKQNNLHPDLDISASVQNIVNSQNLKIAVGNQKEINAITDKTNLLEFITEDNNIQVVDMVLFIGQSNMEGRGNEITSTDVPADWAYEYKSATDEIVHLDDPVGENLPGRAAGGSLIPAFAKSYYENIQENRIIVAVHGAKGGTSISEWQKGGSLFDQAVQRFNQGKTFIDSQPNMAVGRVYYIWLQGERDAVLGTTKDSYKTQFTQFHNDMMNGIGANENGFMIRIGYDYRDTTDTLAVEQIMLAQNELADELSDLTMISKLTSTFTVENGLMQSDEVHYSQDGYNQLGEESAQNLTKYLDTRKPPILEDNVF
jgi:Carbohydrate esterase, sialic acid-specific acetylesterase